MRHPSRLATSDAVCAERGRICEKFLYLRQGGGFAAPSLRAALRAVLGLLSPQRAR